MDEFSTAVHYFGDNPKKLNTSEFFNIFAEFITKFEVRYAHSAHACLHACTLD